MEEKQFADGMIAKHPHENVASFVKAHIAIKADEAIAMLEKQKKADGWVNLDLKESKGGKLYLEVNTWQPPKNDETEAAPEVDPEHVPF